MHLVVRVRSPVLRPRDGVRQPGGVHLPQLPGRLAWLGLQHVLRAAQHPGEQQRRVRLPGRLVLRRMCDAVQQHHLRVARVLRTHRELRVHGALRRPARGANAVQVSPPLERAVLLLACAPVASCH